MGDEYISYLSVAVIYAHARFVLARLSDICLFSRKLNKAISYESSSRQSANRLVKQPSYIADRVLSSASRTGTDSPLVAWHMLLFI